MSSVSANYQSPSCIVGPTMKIDIRKLSIYALELHSSTSTNQIDSSS